MSAVPGPTLDVALAQMSSQDDLQRNLDTVARLAREAAERGVRLLVLPENFAFFGPESERRQHAEQLGDLEAPIQAALARLARQHALAIVGGGMPERSGDPKRPHNTCLVFGPTGTLLGGYRKVHLFDVDLADGTRLHESAVTTPGEEPCVVPLGDFKLGLSVCYDVRFPELYRRLVDLGANVLLVPSAFTVHTGKDHWHVLLRARAIEAQCWVLAAGQFGRHPKGRTTYGHSLAIDPWGTVVAEAPDRPGLVLARLDIDRLQEVRRGLPSLEHRRL